MSYGNAFDVLKRVLKSRGLTYSDLADLMDVSEPTIKRLFVDRDCKLSRLDSICRLLDLSLPDLLEIADRNVEPVLSLTCEVEQVLADSPALFYLFLLLRDEMSLSDIGSIYGLDEADLHLYARDLERLGLIELSAKGSVTLSSTAPISFTLDGPLQQLHTDLNMDFLKRSINHAVENPTAYVTISRRMRPETATLLDEDVRSMVERISKLARQDRLSSPQSELIAVKWCFAKGMAKFSSLFTVGAHPDKRM